MPEDRFASFSDDPQTFGKTGALVTPAATDLDPIPKAVVCLTAGDITVVPMNNLDATTIAFVGVAAGFIPPYRVRRVTAATATVATVL